MQTNFSETQLKDKDNQSSEKILIKDYLKKFLRHLDVIGLCRVKLLREIKKLD